MNPSTDQPVSAEEGRRAAGAKGKPAATVAAAVKEKEVEKEDPTSPLDAEFSSSEEEDDEEYPPVSPPTVTGKLTQLNGLWWAETPDLWRDAMDTVATMAAISAFAGMTTRAQQTPTAKPQPAVNVVDEGAPTLTLTMGVSVPAKGGARAPTRTSPAEQQPAAIRPGEPLVDKQDWKLISTEFARLQSKYARVLGGPFQVDACCDAMGQNRQVSAFWTNCLSEQWRGRIVWCNPPFSDPDVSIDDILKHYASEARQDPCHTAALFLLPDFPQASWRPLPTTRIRSGNCGGHSKS